MNYAYICYIHQGNMGKKKKTLLVGGILLLFILAMGVGVFHHLLFAPQFYPPNTSFLYIDRDDTADSVYIKVKKVGNPHHFLGFKEIARWRNYPQCLHTGRYVIRPGESVYQVFNRLYRGEQEPTHLIISGVRTLEQLARSIGEQVMIDSIEVIQLLEDTLIQKGLGYTKQTMPCLFIPDTYEVYWNISANEFLKRMEEEHQKFWNPERMKKAEGIGMTPEEVCTLASIVEEETNNNSEKAVIAGLYINRLRAKMPLQADPTVKFALQDFTLRRISNAHLKIDSPYNTYLHTGLPPGPIRIPTPFGVNAVLNYTHHNYLYMCAKEDFSGTHNFASTYAEHVRNARKYWQALNKRKIFK